MGRFYIRVFKDGTRERTWGCGSRGENHQHFKKYLENLLKCNNGHIPTNYGTRYRIELIKNRHGEKELYREIEIELCTNVSYTVCKDVTYITEGFDPRIMVLPPNW